MSLSSKVTCGTGGTGAARPSGHAPGTRTRPTIPLGGMGFQKWRVHMLRACPDAPMRSETQSAAGAGAPRGAADVRTAPSG
ncbi:hypothetical protein GCM10010512_46850 [Streptomyces thermoviolaceus subsp. thermoviolaceus]|nr:hypothetical protein GCM10010499_43850 [Streptomyces thermoviolaceus subsp. apingens]GHB10027.1 hypothetical protein GCM10010512_46850 [Streptomyces thermoviolaceus subsp. thermoviolaceus]